MHTPPQRGAATLVVVTLVLLLAMLAAAFASRVLVVDQKSSANLVRHQLAFEAADAAAQWAAAMLNGGHIDAHCEPVDDAAGNSFRERFAGGGAAQPGCVAQPDGWQCACADGGLAGVAPADGPVFTVQLRPASDGTVALEAHGCNAAGRACLAGAEERSDAHARVRERVALLPLPRSLPTAALVAGGDVDLRAGDGVVANPDATVHGVAILAGGSVQWSPQGVSGVAGSDARSAVVEHDSELARADAARLFHLYFGVDRETFTRLPTVTRLVCGADCGSAVQAAWRGGARAVLIAGDAQLAGEGSYGSDERPLLLVVDGHLTFDGPARVHGLVFVGATTWQAGGGASLRGAVIAAGQVRATGRIDLHHDRALLERLQSRAGAFVRVPGSWSDLP